MGNMLESDSSGSSDVEIEEAVGKPKERTAGDGMESDIVNLPTMNDTSAPSARSGNTVKDGLSVKLNLEIKHLVHDKNDDIRKVFESECHEPRTPIIATKLEGISLSTTSSIAGKSPRTLPSRDLLIPVKPPRLDNNIAGASGKSPRLTQASVKQRTPKFVPYEPYSGAIRPMTTSQGHTRKPSDSSSVVSQSSTISECHADTTVDHYKNNESSFIATSGDFSPQHLTQSPHGPTTKKSGTTHYHRDHPSTTLMKERLKMAEKEIYDLQSENARLKKLFVDSMAGGSSYQISTGTGAADSIRNLNSSPGQNANNLQHGDKECVDNLNDELEVSRSKFLSSCVLVDQLTSDNRDLSGSINEAAEIIRDLKNTASLTLEQYEHINDWLRKTHQTSYSSLMDPDSNFCQD